MPTKSLKAPSVRGQHGYGHSSVSVGSSRHLSAAGGNQHPNQSGGGSYHANENDDEVQCVKDIVGALGGVLDSSVAMTRDSEHESLELLGLLVELFESVEETIDAAFADRSNVIEMPESEPSVSGQSPAAVIERVAVRMGTLLHRGQPLQTLSRFLPLRLTVSTKLRYTVLNAILSIVGCAARVERLSMELECFGAGTFNAHISGRHATSEEEFTRRVDEGMERLAPTDTLVASCMSLAFRASDGEKHLREEGGDGVFSPFGRGSAESGGLTDRELSRLLLFTVCDDSAGVSETNRALAAEILFLAHHHWPFLVEQSLCPVLTAPNDTPSTAHSHNQFRSLPMQHLRLGVLLRFTFHEPCTDTIRSFLCGIVRLVAKRKPEALIPPPRSGESAPFGTSGAPMSPSQMFIAFLDPASSINKPYFEFTESILNTLERLDQKGGPSNTNASNTSSVGQLSKNTFRLPSVPQKLHAAILSQGRCYVLILECLADMLAVVHSAVPGGANYDLDASGHQSNSTPTRRNKTVSDALDAGTDCTGHGSWYWPDVVCNTQYADGFRRVMDATLRLQSQFRTDVPPALPDALLPPMEKRCDESSLEPIIALEDTIFDAALKVAKAALLLEGRYQGPTRVYPYGSQALSGSFDRPCDLILFKQLSGVGGPSSTLPSAGTRKEKLSTSERYHMTMCSIPVWKNALARAQNTSYFNTNFYSTVLQGLNSPQQDKSMNQQRRLSLAVADLPKRHRGMERLRLLRFAVAHAFSRQAIKMVAAAFEVGFESLSASMITAQEQLKMEPHRKKAFLASLQENAAAANQQGEAVDSNAPLQSQQSNATRIAAVAASSSDRLAEALLVESTLLSALVLAKCPSARYYIRRTVSGFDSWALNLFSLMDSVLQHPKVQRSVTQYLVIVDSFQCILNDGEQATHIDTFDGKRIANAMIREQEKRQFQWERRMMEEQMELVRADESIGGMPPEEIIRAYRVILSNLETSSCFGLDATTIQFFLSQGSGVFRAQRRPFTPQIAELSFVLANELLMAATRTALLGDRDITREAAAQEELLVNEKRADNAEQRRISTNILGMRDGGHEDSFEDAANKARRMRATSPRPGTASARAIAVGKERPMATSYDRWMAEKSGNAPSNFANNGGGGTPASKAIINAIVPNKKKEPFRPTSTAKHRDLTPSLRAKSPGMNRSGRSGLNDSNTSSSKADISTSKGGPMSLQDVITATDNASDANEYLSVAITMHLPVKFGPHYHRSQKAAVRQVRAPSGQVYVQPVHRNAAQSWSAEDVFVGELYVLFTPFHRLSLSRIDDEIETVRRHLLDVRKKLVTTPATQRSRRWFLTDMLNHVLPKTEMLLHELRQLLDYYTADDVRYQLSVIRATDEIQRRKEDIFEAAVEDSDSAMPRDVLRLSNGRFKDVIHSGNLLFALHRLKDLYQRKQHRGIHGGDDEDGAYGDMDSYDIGGGGGSVESPERAAIRMRELERHLARLGEDDMLDDGADAESVYDGLMSARQEAPQHRMPPSETTHMEDEYDDEPYDDEPTIAKPDFDPDPEWYRSDQSNARPKQSALDVDDLKAFAEAAYRM